MNIHDFNKQWKENYVNTWRSLLQTNNEWDKNKIKNELHDLVFVLDQISKIYCELINGLLSKPMYYADTIISLNNDE